MAVLAHEVAALPGAADAALGHEVFAGVAEAAALWRRLEAEGARGTPYQRLAWVEAYLGALGEGAAARVLVLRDPDGRPRLLMPLALRREAGLVVARPVGGRQANFHLPLHRDLAELEPRAVRAALRRAGRAMGVDLFAFPLQPIAWDGAANPLAEGGLPASSDAYGMALDPDPEAAARAAFGADARKKLRSKERRLVEALGPVAHRRAATAAEVDAGLAAFFRMKAARFAQIGVADPFAGAPARDFLRRACLAGLAEGRPAVELHALVAERDERVLAVYAGAVDAARFSGMVTAFEGEPEIARASPGDQLLLRLVRDQAARGRRFLDLGAGEARYKASTCDLTIPLVENWVAVTPPGHGLAAAQRAAARLRRRIKRSPRAMALARRIARWRGA